MENLKLKRWAELLLDTGKRNNLINFKNRYTSVVEIVHPHSFTLFSKVLSDYAFEPIYLLDGEKFSLLQATDEEKKFLFKEKYASRVKRAGDVLLFTDEIRTLSTLKNISKKARLATEETGVNIAYMAFGFIHWFEKNEHEEYLAPVLLVPVIFENRGALKAPKIHVLESEITLNPSFEYKCEKEFGVILPAYENQTLEEYLTLIGEKIGPLGWFVSDECKISTFSFLKINMYRDIEDNEERILKNPNVQILLGDESVLRKKEFVAEDAELHSVVDADESQEEAIRAVKSGESIVLQGPPGTGKSQTITNIIAECLADGKKVLFVSEKLAALNVVYEKLKSAGLNDFCLELHSHKANKKDFIAEINKTLKAERVVLTERAGKEIELKNLAKNKLQDYKTALHKKDNKIKKSVYELINDYFECDKSPDFYYTEEGVESVDEETFLQRIEVLQQFEEYAKSICYDYRNYCWYGYCDEEVSFLKRKEVEETIKKLIELFEKAEPFALEVKEKFLLNIENLYELRNVGKTLSYLSNSTLITPALIESPRALLDAVITMKEIALNIQECEKQISLIFNDDVYSLASECKNYYSDLQTKYNTITARIFIISYKKLINEFSKNLKSGKKINYKQALCYTNKLALWQELTTLFNENESKIKECFGTFYKGVYSDWDAMIKEIDTLISLISSCPVVAPIVNYSLEKYNSLLLEFGAVGGAIETLFEDYQESLRRMDVSFDKNIFSFRTEDFIASSKKLEKMQENIDFLSDWCYFYKVILRAKNMELGEFIDYYLDDNLQIDKLTKTYKREFYRSYAEKLILSDPVLHSFTRISQDKTVEVFIDKDKTCLQVNKAKIKASLSDKRPNLSYVAPGSEVSVLLHEGAKKRMQKSVRRLLLEAGETIQLLKPCFLMSPLSVSTFLVGGRIDFDVVVFDEASQIFPQDAIGAIYRGKQIVVVGDSKQMPPSNFFMNTVTGAIEEDFADEEVSDYESILDICSACFTQKCLKWHYRSKHESLIAFSNRHFYESSLISFPSVSKKRVGLGVDYYYAGGIYEQSARVNRKEAEMVADLVFEHFDKNPHLSLGVVAFNMSQQNYIEKVINARRIENPAYEKFFNESAKEYFFVKNLETVQGDERDVIIFSVAYAKNFSGKFIHNFGPLNHVGGERRLNVAVTRAKRNVKLVCSIDSSDIDLSRTGAEGARLLKEYIAYAESGKLEPLGEMEKVDADGFENEIASFIEENGYAVEKKVGQSSAKIDIAVKSENKKQFMLAIECDGTSYSAVNSARDRERLRKQILMSAGWSYYRIWSVDWFRNNGAEREKLLKILTKCINISDHGGVKTLTKEVKSEMDKYSLESVEDIADDISKGEISEDLLPEGEEIVSVVEKKEVWAEPLLKEKEEKDFGFPVYNLCDVDAFYLNYGSNFQTFVKEVLKVEAPLSEQWFLRRIVHLFGRSVVNITVINSFNSKMKGCEYHGIIRKNGFLYLEEKTEFNLRVPSDSVRRTIDCIAVEELAGGLLRIVNHNVSIEKERLFKTLAYRLGVSKINAMARIRFEQALLLIASKINIDGLIISKK